MEAALASGALVEGEAASAARPRSITPAALAARLESKDAPVLVDARPPSAYVAGRLPGALGFPLESLRRSTPDLPKDRVVVVYDASAARAGAAAALLAGGGREVFILEGGVTLWSMEGRRLESGAPP